MNVAVRERTLETQATRLAAVDSDIHSQVRAISDLTEGNIARTPALAVEM